MWLLWWALPKQLYRTGTIASLPKGWTEVQDPRMGDDRANTSPASWGVTGADPGQGSSHVAVAMGTEEASGERIKPGHHLRQ